MVEQSTGSSVFTLLKTQPICLKTIHQVSLGMQHSAVVTSSVFFLINADLFFIIHLKRF